MKNGTISVEPLNNGHIGGRNLVLNREVIVPTSKPYQVESVEGCGFRDVKSRILCSHIQNQPEMLQID